MEKIFVEIRETGGRSREELDLVQAGTMPEKLFDISNGDACTPVCLFRELKFGNLGMLL